MRYLRRWTATFCWFCVKILQKAFSHTQAVLSFCCKVHKFHTSYFWVTSQIYANVLLKKIWCIFFWTHRGNQKLVMLGIVQSSLQRFQEKKQCMVKMYLTVKCLGAAINFVSCSYSRAKMYHFPKCFIELTLWIIFFPILCWNKQKTFLPSLFVFTCASHYPIAPEIVFKIMQFSGKLRGKTPLFWANFGLRASLGSKLRWPPGVVWKIGIMKYQNSSNFSYMKYWNSSHFSYEKLE